ncbi:MAG: serine protease Do [Natrialbaceae archaeon]|jgi:serine protease Do
MNRNSPSRRRFLGLAGSAILTGLAGCSAPSSTESTPTGTATVGDEDRTKTNSESVYTRVYRETIGSVVLVETDSGQGTGFVFDESHVVTNAHVVGRANSVEIRFREGEWRTGEVVGTDPYSDLAVIQVSERPDYASPIRLVEVEPAVGQEVVVIGNPFGLSGTLTAGIVSGVNRSIDGPTGFSIPDAIQTDAAVNPGNSGGPIVSLDGDVIAVINSGGGDNVAFGISAPLVRRVAPALIEEGEFEHSYMGVTLTTVTPPIARTNDLENAQGIMVVEVLDGEPSDGVLQGNDDTAFVDGQRVPVGGDVILAMDDVTLSTVEELSSFLALQTSPGDEIEITVVRDGERQTVLLELGRRPPV